MKTKPCAYRSTALLYAVLFLRDHNFSADPVILRMFVDAWLASCGENMDQELAKHCGIHAAKECACPMLKGTITKGEWLNPEDLRD